MSCQKKDGMTPTFHGKKNLNKKNLKSWCHTKRRAGEATRPCPSLGMTTTFLRDAAHIRITHIFYNIWSFVIIECTPGVWSQLQINCKSESFTCNSVNSSTITRWKRIFSSVQYQLVRIPISDVMRTYKVRNVGKK